MYNGIGLTTARGSGTNGYVQRNMAFVRNRKEKVDYKTEADFSKSDSLQSREPNLEILEHERKRKIELKCMELRELMEDQGYEFSAIELKVNAFRVKLIEKDKLEKPQVLLDESGRVIALGTHQIAAASQDRNKKLRDAFGLSDDFADGSSLDPLRKQKELERKATQKKYAIIKDPEERGEATGASKKMKSGAPIVAQAGFAKNSNRKDRLPSEEGELPDYTHTRTSRVKPREKTENVQRKDSKVNRRVEDSSKGRHRRRSRSEDPSCSPEAHAEVSSKSRIHVSAREQPRNPVRQRDIRTSMEKGSRRKSIESGHDSPYRFRRKPLSRMTTPPTTTRMPTRGGKNSVSPSSDSSRHRSRSPKSTRTARQSSRSPEKRPRSPYSLKRRNKERFSRYPDPHSPDSEQGSTLRRRQRSRS